MEIFDTLARKIRVVLKSKGDAWVKYNGIKTDENGVIIAGRYVELESLSIESLVADGLGVVEVENELTGKTYNLDLTKKDEEPPKVEKVEEVKPKRKRRTKKEMQEAKKG